MDHSGFETPITELTRAIPEINWENEEAALEDIQLMPDSNPLKRQRLESFENDHTALLDAQQPPLRSSAVLDQTKHLLRQLRAPNNSMATIQTLHEILNNVPNHVHVIPGANLLFFHSASPTPTHTPSYAVLDEDETQFININQ